MKKKWTTFNRHISYRSKPIHGSSPTLKPRTLALEQIISDINTQSTWLLPCFLCQDELKDMQLHSRNLEMTESMGGLRQYHVGKELSLWSENNGSNLKEVYHLQGTN